MIPTHPFHLSALIAAVLVGAPAAALKGRLTDIHTGETLDSVFLTLKVSKKTVESDAQGRFDFASTPSALGEEPGAQGPSSFSAGGASLPVFRADGKILLITGFPSSGSLSFSLLDARGRLSRTLDASPSAAGLAVSLEGLKAGAYLLRGGFAQNRFLLPLSSDGRTVRLGRLRWEGSGSGEGRTAFAARLPADPIVPILILPDTLPPVYQFPLPIVLPPLGIVNDTLQATRPGYVPLHLPVNLLAADSLQLKLTSLKLQGMKKIPAGQLALGGKSYSIRGLYIDSVEVTRSQYLSIVRKPALPGIKPIPALPRTTAGTEAPIPDKSLPILNLLPSTRPKDSLTLFDALLYCNARSKAAGLDTVYTYTGITRNEGSAVALAGLAFDSLKLGFRLPTKREWQYAALAGKNQPYPWGTDTALSTAGLHAWYKANGNGMTHPVGLKKPNDWGLYDMLGNAAEFVFSPTFVSVPNPLIGGVDPLPAWQTLGGGFHSNAAEISPWNEDGAALFAWPGVGFRVVLNAPARIRDILIKPIPIFPLPASN